MSDNALERYASPVPTAEVSGTPFAHDDRNALYAWTVSQPVEDHSWMRHLPKWSPEDWLSEFRRDDNRLLRHQKRERDYRNALRLQSMQPEMPDSGPPGSDQGGWFDRAVRLAPGSRGVAAPWLPSDEVPNVGRLISPDALTPRSPDLSSLDHSERTLLLMQQQLGYLGRGEVPPAHYGDSMRTLDDMTWHRQAMPRRPFR